MRLFQINQKEFAARVIDPGVENDDLSTAEEADLINKVSGEEDTASEANPPPIKGDDDDMISDEDSIQSVEDDEADEDTESQIPSGIMRLILEP